LGLGLAIVRHLVELHGGTAHVDSEGEGKGSTFTIRLPLALRDYTKATTREMRVLRSENGSLSQSKPLPSLNNIQILLVDDDRDTLDVLTAMLIEYNAEVQTASSAAEAIETLQWHKPDVIISDLAMPDEDGYSLLNRIRDMESIVGKRVPVIALTAYVRVEDRARALSAGFDMFVPKPVEPGELIATVLNVVQPGRS
jgi:CheY-like chemotaxis protein